MTERQQHDSGGVRAERTESGDLAITVPRPERFKLPLKILGGILSAALVSVATYGVATGRHIERYAALQERVSSNTAALKKSQRDTAATRALVMLLCASLLGKDECSAAADLADRQTKE